jgi:hypothetical protein
MTQVAKKDGGLDWELLGFSAIENCHWESAPARAHYFYA